MKRVYIIFVLCAVTLASLAQKFVAEAPSHVAVGEQFRLTYTINTQDASGFHVGNIPDALEVLMGPSTSSWSNIQIINGRTTATSSITYTYILCANKAGKYDIPAASISADGKKLTSNKLRITVSGSAGGGSSQAQSQRRGRQQIREAGSRISGSDLFIKVSASKKRVHEQEPILLTYKVYTLVGLLAYDGKMPDLKGFYTQEIKLPQPRTGQLEIVNGRQYNTLTICQYVMFPQKSGKLDIPSITFDIFTKQERFVDPFEAFFNGGSDYVEVKRKVKAPGLTIDVEPLPTRPADFSGGVGHFNISAQLNKQDVKANDPVTLRVTVSGVGNLKLVKTPIVNFPKDFDKYDAKVTDKTKLTTNGVEGSMVYDFLAIPRNPGKYEIPAVEFTYFDTGSNSYKTVKSEPFTLNVAKGTGNGSVTSYTGKEDLTMLNKDIRHIKTGDADIHDVDDFFFASTAYWISLSLLVIIFVSLFVIFRQRAIDNANVGKMRGKKANKMASKRLKKAKALLVAGRGNDFYDEVLRALWGYIGDKLNMPVEHISRDNISQCLAERNVDEATISQFISALDECEFARYAPGDAKGNMDKTFESAMTTIMNIEEAMKKKTKPAKRDAVTVLLIMLMSSLSLSAYGVTKAEADSAYVNQNYTQAINDYEALLKEGVSADIYYNLGNAYYRADNITRAVLNYERALLLSPGDKDIRFNLQMARSKTVDKIVPETEMFFTTWYRSLVNTMSVDGWARMALVALCLVIVFSLLYLFASRIVLRKVGFFSGMAFLLIFLVSNIFAYQQKKVLSERTGAIIMSPAVQVKSTPAKNGTDLFILHEGTKVEITDASLSGWTEIRLADGKEGWVETSQIEVI